MTGLLWCPWRTQVKGMAAALARASLGKAAVPATGESDDRQSPPPISKPTRRTDPPYP